MVQKSSYPDHQVPERGDIATNETRRYFSLPVKKIEDNQVFVFGSNLNGFHGAGAAGFAMRGDYRNNWRQDKKFIAAMKASKGSQARIGLYAVYGVGEGPMLGSLGKSYAIPTVTRPGARKSRSPEQILSSLKRMGKVAEKRPQFDFLCCIAGGGYNGYSWDEIKEIYRRWVLEDPPPANVLFPEKVRS